MKKILQGQIEAIVPTYSETGGNYTIMKRVDGDLLLEKSIKTVLKNICKFYHYDLDVSNKEYGHILGIKKMPPIPFTKDLIFIAVKTRRPIGKDDGAFSYVNIEEIEKVKDKTIYFKDGKYLKALAEDKTVEKKIKLAKLLKSKANERPLIIREAKNPYPISLEDKLDIKNDLIIIYEKIQDLEKTFFKLTSKK